MKVQNTVNKSTQVPETIAKEDKKSFETKGAEFKEQLKFAEGKSIEDKMQVLVKKIIEQGEKLGKKADIRELKVYKKLISEFLEEAVSNSHQFTKKNFLDRRGRHKVYAIVKKVNQEVETLTKEILESEKDNIKILKKLDDIRGLIMDIIM